MRSRSSFKTAAVPHALAPSRAAVIGLGVAALLLGACPGNKGQPGAQSPERQSDAEYDLARDLFSKGQPRAALDHAMKAVTLNEENDKAQYFVAVIHLAFCSTDAGFSAPDCRLTEVEKYARAALKANPDFRDAKNMLGQVLVNEKRCKEAMQVLEPLTKDPAYVHPFYAWGNLGDAQLCEGQTDAAISSLKNAIAAEPRFCVGHYRLGTGYEKKKDFTNAEASLTQAVTADPQCDNLQDAWFARCRVRFGMGKNDDARKDCERCREISNKTNTGKACEQLLASKGGAPPAAAPSTATAPSPVGKP